MRMKKLLILSAAVLGAVACSNTYEVKTAPEKAIGFGTWAETLTKAVTPDETRVPGSNTFRVGDSFAVYGYKSASDDSGKSTVFDDDVVVATAEDATPAATTWDYDNHRFWDTSYDKYTFFGVSPSSFGTGGTVDAKTGVISTDVTFAGNNNDVLIANKTVVEKGTNSFSNYGTVNLVFNHTASLVDIFVKKSPALADPTTIKVTAFQLENIKSKGTLAVNTYAATTPYKPTIALENWTWDNSTIATYTQGVTSVMLPVVVVEDTAFPGDDASDVPAAVTYNKVMDNLVVMPQAFLTTGTRQQIKLTYTITTKDGNNNESTNTYADKILYLSDFDNIDDKDQGGDTTIGSWEPGKHYIFYITIDANEIKFSAEISDWDTTVINGYNYLIN